MGVTEGVITAMATPFNEDGSLDHDGARRLSRHLADNGSHGVVVAGTTGECPTLSDAEQIALLETVLEQVGDEINVICGTGSNDTRHAIELTRAADAAGADGMLVVAPYYNKPNEAGLRAHFAAVAEATEKPILLYNIPGRCVVNMGPDLLAELGRTENIVGVKQANNEEAAPVEGLDLIAGNDEIFLHCLEAGGTGGILVSSHLAGPRMREIYEAATAGDLDRAREIDRALAPLYEAMAVTANPIPLKAGLEALGLIGPTLRLPMVPADEQQRAVVAEALRQTGVASA